MCNCVFSFANNYCDYKNLTNKNIDFLFSNNIYGKDCISLNKKVSLFDCFVYLKTIEEKYNFYLYFSSKGRFVKGVDFCLNNNDLYLNYYKETIYFLKYDYYLYKLYNLFENDLKDDNFINFLSDYFSSFDYKINENLYNKFIFPKNKLLYNACKFKCGR